MGFDPFVSILTPYMLEIGTVLTLYYSILWTAVFGIFGDMYIHEKAEGDGGIKRMKNAVWIDLINMLLWLITSVMAVVVFFTMRGGRSLHTGRASA